MPAVPKPHRIAVLVPDVTIEGSDAAYEREASILLWTACLETLQRHPRLAVLDADVTPLFPQDGHFAPQQAGRGGRPTDAFFGPTRRDEVLWLELALAPKSRVVRLHVVGRDGKQESFEALGRNVGEQIQQVFGAWLTARALGVLPRPFEPVSTDDVLAVLRVVAPTLAEQARAWSLPVADKPAWRLALVEEDENPSDDPGRTDTQLEQAELSDDFSALESTIDSTLEADPVLAAERRPSIARPLANRLPVPLRVAALRLLELALREDLGEQVLAIDAEHPQALFARLERSSVQLQDFALLRRVIASAPNWARPYELLRFDDERPDEALLGRAAPSELEAVAAAGVATLLRPAQLEVLETAGAALHATGRTDEALRLAERARAMHDDNPRAHLAVLDLHKETDRVGAWLEHAMRSMAQHGCPMDPGLPWYPDQIHVDLRASNALLSAGRLDEAIALRANRLEGREAHWPTQTRSLQQWRKEPRFVAWCYAREGHCRGDEARAVEGFGRIEPEDSLDLAILLDSLVALGREDEVPLAWAQFGLGRGYDGPSARLAAARGLMAAGEWRRGIEELWRVELTEPGRDEYVAIARCGLVLSGAPIEVLETALGDRIAIGAPTLARRMARDVADFVPAAAKSGLVARALGQGAQGTKPGIVEFSPDALSGFAPDARSRRAIDALFAELGPVRKSSPSGFDIADELQRGDRLVNRWLEVAFAEASEDDRAALAQAAAYTAAQALGRYLAATTAPPTAIAGALRTVAGEALALVRRHRTALADRDARALLGTLDPVLRRVDRWIAASWLSAVERALGIDERSGGDIAGFARDYPVVAARVLGPEETAVLSWTVARLHRERPDGWAAKVVAQASQLATHSGSAGLDEWADAVAAQLATRELELEDAIDALHTACYLAEGKTAGPCVHAARVLFEAGRAPAALSVLCNGLRAADGPRRNKQLATLADAWKSARLDVPFDITKATAGVLESLQKGDPARAEKLGRWVVAYDPGNGEAHRNLGLALAQQGKAVDAMHHLMRGTRDQAIQVLSDALAVSGRMPEAMAVLDYASRWYARAEQWLAYAAVAQGAMDSTRTAKAYRLAFQLDPARFDARMLDTFAGVLDQVGDYATYERIAHELVRVAGEDKTWLACGLNHIACALIGQDKFDEALPFAVRATVENPVAVNAPVYTATVERARTHSKEMAQPVATAIEGRQRDPIYGLLEAGDHVAAAERLRDPSWRVRGAALHATRFRLASENHVEVTPRARAAAVATLADTIGAMDRDAVLVRALALQIREQAYFPRDPAPRLGDRMTREAFYQEFRARGGVVLGEQSPPPAEFSDRVVVAGSKVARASDYIALLRDLAALAPREALAQFDLDDAGYLEVARAWTAAMEADPSIARTIEAGLAAKN